MKTVAVLGAGAWGTAIAQTIARKGINVQLWCYESEVAATIKRQRCNELYLPGIQLSDHIIPSDSLNEVITNASYIFEAVPVRFLRSVLQEAKPYITLDHKLVILSKALEEKTALLPSEIIESIFDFSLPLFILFGPSYARDLALQTPTGFVCATIAKKDEFLTLFDASFCHITLSDDIVGVQLCGALKNVITILVGAMQAALYSDNTQALMLHKCLYELGTLITACGGRKETIFSMAGINDIILSAFGKQSKNKECGRQLGLQKKLDDIVQSMKMAPEGIATARSLKIVQEKYAVSLPLFCSIADFIENKISLQDVVNQAYTVV